MVKSVPKISVIVPVYNEEKSIGKVLQMLLDLRKVLPPMEIIVVDDGSTDGTSEEVAAFPVVKYIKHEKNRGKGAALSTGFEVATGDIFVIQDADLEYSPYDIPKLLEPLLSGRADVVYGSRFKGKHDGMGTSHKIGNKILSLVARVLYNAPITDVMTGYKAFSKKAITSINLSEDGFEVEVEITAKVLRNNWRFLEIPISYTYRQRGFSKINYQDGLTSLIKLFVQRFM